MQTKKKTIRRGSKNVNYNNKSSFSVQLNLQEVNKKITKLLSHNYVNSNDNSNKFIWQHNQLLMKIYAKCPPFDTIFLFF